MTGPAVNITATCCSFQQSVGSTNPLTVKMAEDRDEHQSSEISITDQRDELMVDHISCNANQNPTLRTSYFLKPCLNPYSTPPAAPKNQSFSVSSKPNVFYQCLSNPLRGWKTWVENMQETHEQAWRKAGIFDAIKGSTYYFGRVKDLIFKLAERWCPDTNTFVFPWGEATVTLEDVYVLGGFSPLGAPVLSSSCVGENVRHVEDELIKSYRKLMRIDSNVSHLRWQEHFMGCGNKEIEHAGFLSLWLTRHVFGAGNSGLVAPRVFSMAARLSCGVKLALGPAVLAAIYKDLTLLKTNMVDSFSGHCYGGSPLKLFSPIHLVQVWAWERFSSLRPLPRMIIFGEPRLARWEAHLRKTHDVDIAGCLDSASETFRWRPYAMSLENWSLPTFYVDLERWVVVDSGEEWELFARCLMVCQLTGLDSVLQGYNPHRVALQFGFDQDIPEFIDRSKADCELDSIGYQKSLKGSKLYIPHRLHEGDVTCRYSDWWRTELNVEEEALICYKRKKKTSNRGKKISKVCDRMNKFEAMDIAGGVKEKPMENSSPSNEFSPRNLLRVDNDNRVTSAHHIQIGLNSLEEKKNECHNSPIEIVNEAELLLHQRADHALGEFSKVSEGGTSLTRPMTGVEALIEHEIDVVGQVKVMSQETWPEAGSDMCQDDAMEENQGQILIEHNIIIDEKNENLKADTPQIERATECNETLPTTACKDEQNEALCCDTLMNHTDIPVDVQVAVNDDKDNFDDNPFARLYLEYEARISRLETEIPALFAVKVMPNGG